MKADARRILLLQGHPDRCGGHYCHALAQEYVRGARERGHTVEIVDIAALDFGFLRSREDMRYGTAPADIMRVQALLLASDHVLLVHPVWNGGAPAKVRAFMEHAFRPSFTFPDAPLDARLTFTTALTQRKALAGKTAHVITTMQMPAIVYRIMFRPHQEANALWLAGARPVKQTAVDKIDTSDDATRARWLARAFALGRRAS